MDTILSLAQKLISIRSTTENISALNEAILLTKNYLPGFVHETFSSDGKPSLLIHNANQETKQFTIILNVHLDVIHGKELQFKPFILDGKLYGRGAYDMKAAAAVMILLFKEIAALVPYGLALQITTDEETGSNGAKKQIEEGYRGDFILTGECGSNFKITNWTKGVYHAKLIATGKTSHSAYPWMGDNALTKLLQALNRIATSYPLPRKESFDTTVNITQIKTTNETHNRTPDQAEAYLDIRYTPEESTIMSEIKKMLPKGVKIEIIAHFSPLNTSPENKYLMMLREIGGKILHQEIQLRKTHGTSDVIRFSEVGCAGVEFGPIGANQHNNDEWVDIKSLEIYHQILKQFLLSVK